MIRRIPSAILAFIFLLPASAPAQNLPPAESRTFQTEEPKTGQTGAKAGPNEKDAVAGVKEKPSVIELPDGDVSLWPEIEPFETGYLKVSDLHQIYYELSGNPGGKPVFVLHGGPGGHTSPYMRRFFNPGKFMIVLHDQRGSGKSMPSGELRENTTPDLVSDIEKLRKHLKCHHIILFGGSWGTTLALAYAEMYPQEVSGMVLRGVFTATKEDIDFFYHGGVRSFFPDAYDELLAVLPEPDKRPLPQYLYELLRTEDPAKRLEYSRAWARYEIKISGLEVSDAAVEQLVMPENRAQDIYVFSLFENYYMANGCFMEEGRLLRDTEKIKHIPAVIVNGRYDVVCPPDAAYDLHKRLPRSKLIIAESSGHWMGEPAVERALLRAMKAFE